jgi:hypothetical protein
MIFWLVLKLEFSYRVIISCRILVSFGGFFRRLYFYMVKYLSFHNSSLYIYIYIYIYIYVCVCECEGHNVRHPLWEMVIRSITKDASAPNLLLQDESNPSK